MEWKVKYIDESEKLAKAFRRAGWIALRRLGFLVRKKAQQSIIKEEGPSAPGTPPNTHDGRHGVKEYITTGRKHTRKKTESHKGLLPASILYSTLDEGSPGVIIGTAKNVISTIGGLHEHGGTDRRGVQYPARPFMEPAFESEIGSLPGILSEQFGKV